MAAQFEQTWGGLIAQAGREIGEQRTRFHRRRREEAAARRGVLAIDEVVAQLEERHLMGERTFDRLLRQRVTRLGDVVGQPLPRKVVRARNTVRLHAALLDWQETLLDQAIPARALFPDRHERSGSDAIDERGGAS